MQGKKKKKISAPCEKIEFLLSVKTLAEKLINTNQDICASNGRKLEILDGTLL